MAKKEITSRPGLFGTTNHYDSRGQKVGSSNAGVFASQVHYDNRGHKVGTSYNGIFGTNHYDSKGHKTRSTYPGWFGDKKTEFNYKYQNQEYDLEMKLLGKYNLYNMLSVITLLSTTSSILIVELGNFLTISYINLPDTNISPHLSIFSISSFLINVLIAISLSVLNKYKPSLVNSNLIQFKIGIKFLLDIPLIT